MEPYIESIGTLQDSAFWLAKVAGTLAPRAGVGSAASFVVVVTSGSNPRPLV